MKHSIFAIIIAISFVSVAVFGFWLMTHDQMMGHGSCVANTIQGSLCAKMNPFAFAGFHISAFNNFVSVVIQNLAIAALMVFALTAAIAMTFLGMIGTTPPIGLARWTDYGNRAEFVHKIRFIFWCSLHENSPSFIRAR